jgi:hypothetical protein
VSAVAVAPQALPSSDSSAALLVAALDPAFLDLVSWDWDVGVLRFPSDHPVLGRRLCKVAGCGKESVTFATGLPGSPALSTRRRPGFR